ncbi:hypothetical protein [Serratia ficaria]|uniref:hypothetical protein n=1 Tax=Serratia ficaria TaxID=61651 RepID=UPI002177CFA6|nr:hypothetical protein [Serratia ficaria]CAI1019303.1 Uncharacterised protein [Serratia ficaria]CAI1974985.1 Uncharacterised protein [Serratia ficaria]
MTTIEMIKNLALRSGVVASADVLAVFAELEAKDKRITGLERHVKDLEATLMAATDEVADLTKERNEARAKLATPVRLPKRWDVSGQVNPPRIVQVQFEQQNRTHDQCAEAIRSAGFTFTVEGDK